MIPYYQFIKNLQQSTLGEISEELNLTETIPYNWTPKRDEIYVTRLVDSNSGNNAFDQVGAS